MDLNHKNYIVLVRYNYMLSQYLWSLGNDGQATKQHCANTKLFASSGDSMTNAFGRKVDDVSYLYPFRSRPVAYTIFRLDWPYYEKLHW